MLLVPAPQKFNTFTTFTTFAIFAKFAKFADFANFEPALEHPTPIHRHAPRPMSLNAPSRRDVPLSCLRRAGYPQSGWRAGGEGAWGSGVGALRRGPHGL
jgi:hypothetical protein